MGEEQREHRPHGGHLIVLLNAVDAAGSFKAGEGCDLSNVSKRFLFVWVEYGQEQLMQKDHLGGCTHSLGHDGG